MDCWAKDYCKKADTEICNKYCIGYLQLKALYNLSNMPGKYQKDIGLEPGEDLKEYYALQDFKESLLEHVDEGHGLYIYSKYRGNGKTTWACKIMNHYFRLISIKNDLSCRGLYINVSEFLDELRKKINNEDNNIIEIERNLRTADIVIWDDIGAEKPSEWVRERLYTFINFRESNNMTQIYTSNKSVEQLEITLGDRIADRIRGQCKILRFSEESKRGADF